MAGGLVPARTLGTHDAPCPSHVTADRRPARHLPPPPPCTAPFLRPPRVARVGPAGVWMEVLGSGDHADAAGVSDPPTPGRTGRHLSGSPHVPVSITADAASSCWEVVGDRPGPLSAPEVGAGPGRARGVRCSRSSLSRQNWLKSLSWGQLRPRRARTS